MKAFLFIISIIAVVIILFTFQTPIIYKIYEPITSKNAMCLLTRNINKLYIDFLSKFHRYDIYIFIDNNSSEIQEYITKYPNMQFIYIEDDEAIHAGYYDSSYIIPKKTISWDKALFYFSKKNATYDYVWFIEEDVYIPNEDSIILLDDKYPTTDLICSKYTKNEYGNLNHNGWVHWEQAERYFSPSWASGLQCICRLSNRLLTEVNRFVETHRKLTFIEVLFTTLALQSNYSHIIPDEFSEVDCCNVNDLYDPHKIYHPIKNMEEQIILRNKI